MSADSRRSIARPAALRGTGVHTGQASSITLRPAPAGHGITFRRTDLPKGNSVPLALEQVSAADRRTALGHGEESVSTVEHLLAAVAAHQIDDLLVEVEGPEAPALDGSAAPYFKALAEAGITPVGGTPLRYRVPAPFTLREGDSTYLVGPHDGLRLTVTIEWPHPAIGRQSGCYDITPEQFERELARARTFGFVRERDALHQRGLSRGADGSNTIALGDTGVVDATLHWPDEFVRHKAADLLGDLALLGGRLEASVVAFRPGHKGNLAVARAIRQAATPAGSPVMGIQEILGVLPHRYPMLLVDRITEIQGSERIVGLKNVTFNEPFFQGHFPGHPIMPGVLIVEAMAQVGGVLLMRQITDPERKLVYFMAIDNVKFRRPVVPGDQLRFEVDAVQVRGKTCRMRGVALVDGQVAAEAEMLARFMDK